MNNTLATTNDRKIAVREYKNSTATTDTRLQFKEFGQLYGLEHGGAEHRAEFSRYCASRNAEGVAYLEKARQAGLSLNKSVETLDKKGNVVGIRLAFSTAKVAKEKTPRLTDAQKVKALSTMSEAELLAEIAKRKEAKA
jgi:hypothetical protein